MTSPFPRKLSETGLFDSVKDRRVAPGVIPYSVNAPYWSDGAQKERFFALPGKTQITDPRSWAYPDGMVAVQTLSLDLEEGNAAVAVPVETRILVKQDEHWMGYTYLWNDARTDACARRAQRDRPRREHQGPVTPGGIRRHDLARSRPQRVHVLPLARGRIRPGPERVADEQGPRLRRRRGQPDPRPRPHRHLQDAAGRLAQVAAPVHRPVRSARTWPTGPGRISTSTARSATSATAAATRISCWTTGPSWRIPRRSVAVPCKERSGSLTR